MTRTDDPTTPPEPRAHDERTCPDCSRVIEETGGNYLPPVTPDHGPGCDVFRIAESWEPYGEPRHCDCGFALWDAKRRGVYNWTPPEPVEARDCPYCDRTESHDHCIECEAMNALPWQHAKWCSHFRPATDFDTPGAAEPIEARDLTAAKTLRQCPGCWSWGMYSGGDIECGCGERMTVVDLRAALRADTARVPEGLRAAAEQWELQPGDKHEVETRYRREGWWFRNQRGDSLFFEPRDAVTFLDYLAALPEGLAERLHAFLNDEGNHVGGVWGDYGEIVVSVGMVRDVIDGRVTPPETDEDSAYTNRDRAALATSPERSEDETE